MRIGRELIVGVTPAFDEGRKLPASNATLYLRREYTRLLAELGAVPLVLTPDMPLDFITSTCDGIIISGGEDIPAHLYGSKDYSDMTEPLERVMWELLIIEECEKQAIPLLGVCYGMQLLAVHYGGSLCQDVETEIEGSIAHKSTKHEVTFVDSFLGFGPGDRPVVASRHHQAVSVLPDTFQLSAEASDGVIEAMRRGDIYGTQWHPESDDTGVRIYAAFLEQCRVKRALQTEVEVLQSTNIQSKVR